MNKTVNINLAGIFFHIDEDAYLKLQRYLEAIKRSFTDSQGRSEIISDIEARIAELFTERIKHDKQVIGIKEVDDVITIMGQPEDYLVDDEIFEDEPVYKSKSSTSKSKKLFRDTDNSYVGGVSSGLGHYLGIDAIWIRLIWVLLIFGAGTGIFIYILLWILVPEATTTADKLTMTGEAVTISNIEKKIRDGFENVSDKVSNIDLSKHGEKLKEGFENVSGSISDSVKRINVDKQGNRIKSSSKSFFDTIGDIIMFFLKLFAKFIGFILTFASGIALIAMIVALVAGNLLDKVHLPGSPFENLSDLTGASPWLVILLVFFAFAIPTFMLFYLGLKILVNNLVSLSNVAKYSLLGLWILSIIGLSVLGVKQGLSYKEEASVVKTEQLNAIKANDTLVLTMKANDYYAENFNRSFHNFNKGYNQNGEQIVYSQGVRLIVKTTRDSVAKLKIIGSARGRSFDSAKERSENIIYNYTFNGKTLELDNHFLISKNDKTRDQKVEVTLYLPEGSTLYADENTYNYHRNDTYRYNDILNNGMEEHYLRVEKSKLICLDCPEEDNDDDDDDDANEDYDLNINLNNDNAKLKVNDEGLKASNQNMEIIINDQGVKAKSKKVNVTIDDEKGIEITADKNQD
ncbi:PspC domain-containing protein [Lacinutrix salivirga]